ncbi:hypothetical protein AAFC00_002084 [Neodothiora populina]|uniref:WD repeat protein n=1 Tax=Neodothiora populina TaxID=2781224 RepID=A0ABR3PGA5_9PEZI
MNRGQRAGTPSNTSNSPLIRAYHASAPRSPITTTHNGKGSQDLGLALKRVIGTTCQSVTCFDCVPSSPLRAFAYTAGAAAVVATIDDHGAITQRFYRANPVQSSTSRTLLYTNSVGRDSPDARYKSPLQTRDYGASHSPRSDWAESPSSKQGNVKERVKAATTLSFSFNGKYIAVGETGYKPRVLIFSLDERAPHDVPAATITEHTFGVQAVSFSPDSKYLASLGAVNDGFLYIWSIDERSGAASLVASNRCTNVIKQMAWIGSNLVTVGLRFVKVWRPQETSPGSEATPDQKFRGPKPLVGRNAVLGDLQEATFTCVVPFAEDKAIVCSDGGDVCILDDSERSQRLTRVAIMGFSVTAACLDGPTRLLVTGSDGTMKALDMTGLQNAAVPAGTPSGSSTPTKSTSINSTHFVAIGAVADIAITVDNHHGVQLRRSPGVNDEEISPAFYAVPAHADAVLGVRALPMPNKSDAAFLTWSAGGTVIYWTSDCEMAASLKIPMSQSVDVYNVTNELKSVTSASSSLTISGDRYGMLRLSDTNSGDVTSCIRAHSGEVTDIAILETPERTLVASGSRDRTIQLFILTPDGLVLSQTLDEHAGSVTCMMFAKAGRQLISCSADRTIVVREAVNRDDGSPVVFVITRTITLKNSPTSMRPSVYQDIVLLSSTDRCINLVNTHSGRIVSSFKAADGDGGDAVTMSSLAHLPSSTGPPIVAGVSSSDKSVRLYTEDGSLLARDWGHTEGVTDIAVIQPGDGDEYSKVVTVAADGTIFVWDTESRRPDSSGSDHSLQVPAAGGTTMPSVAQPLRKVISHSELARFHRTQSMEASENEPQSPTAAAAMRLPTTLKHKSSRLGVKTTPRLDPSPLNSSRVNQSVKSRHRSPSPAGSLPSSPTRTRHPGHTGHVNVRPTRGKSMSTVESDKGISSPTRPESRGFGSVSASTEQLCRTLRAFRQRIEKSPGSVPTDNLVELQNELETTLKFMNLTLGKDTPSMEVSGRQEEKSDKEEEDDSRVASSQGGSSFVSTCTHQSSEPEAITGAPDE